MDTRDGKSLNMLRIARKAVFKISSILAVTRSNRAQSTKNGRQNITKKIVDSNAYIPHQANSRLACPRSRPRLGLRTGF